MKIERDAPERLVITDFPVFSAAWFSFGLLIGLAMIVSGFQTFSVGKLFVGCIFVGIAGFAVAYSLNRTVFDFDLRDRKLHWKRVGVLGASGESLDVDKLDFAYLEFFGAGKRKFYRAVIQSGTKKLPLTLQGIHDYAIVRKVCDAINQLLGKPPRDDAADFKLTLLDLISRGKDDTACWTLQKFTGLRGDEVLDAIQSLRAEGNNSSFSLFPSSLE